MAVYGVLVTSVDTRSETAQMQYDVGTALESEVEAAVAFMRDEISNLGSNRLNEWFRDRLPKVCGRGTSSRYLFAGFGASAATIFSKRGSLRRGSHTASSLSEP